ncbi:MAG: tRNA-dihydrouridine synthase [Patescibacteria group bacterium]
MKSNFWHKLPKPFFILAPMANVTDVVFRELIYERGKPDVFYTEFVSVDGLLSKGREALLVDLQFTPNQHPIVAQIFGSKPENFKVVAAQLKEMGFDGIDINMGCPDKSVERQGAGASLIKNPKLAREIIEATIEGAGGLPVAVKTRLGYNKLEYKEWLAEILKTDITTLIVHLRTRKEMSKVPAHWELMPEIVAMAHAAGKIVVGNGDVIDRADGIKKSQETGVDGIMIGRGIFSNHWLFNTQITQDQVSVKDRLESMVKHTTLFVEKLPMKNFAMMKKHFKVYTLGLPNATDLRAALMLANNPDDVKREVESYLKGV